MDYLPKVKSFMDSKEQILKRQHKKEKIQKFFKLVDPKSEIRFADLVFTNMYGHIQWLETSIDMIPEKIMGGVGIDGSSVGLASCDKSDVILYPETNTIRSWTMEGEKIHSFFCKVYNQQGDIHQLDPRQVLAGVISKGKKMGFKIEMFSELEFYLLDKDNNPNDTAGYLGVPPEDKTLKFRREVCHQYEDAGIAIKRLHHENGEGQHEIELKLQPVMRNCDNTILAWYILRNHALKYGWKLNNDPKPFGGKIGSGMHEHILLRNLDGTNAMLGEDGKLSKIALQFIAGLIKYTQEIVATFAQHKETFQRLKPGFEAPVYSYWGYASRNAMIRIPTVTPGNKEQTRCEFRAGDCSGSPHLFCAMIYAAGLKGIEEQLVCPPNWEGTMKELQGLTEDKKKQYGIVALPKTLEECAEILKTSPICKEVLGEELIKKMSDYQIQLSKK